MPINKGWKIPSIISFSLYQHTAGKALEVLSMACSCLFVARVEVGSREDLFFIFHRTRSSEIVV
jgi:hypothetical protein